MTSVEAARPLRLVSTAPLDWRSGYPYLLLAVRLLLDAGVEVRLRIAANGTDDEPVRYDIDDLELGATVVITSPQPRAPFAGADAVVLAAVAGSHGCSVRAAVGTGLPVVAFELPDIAAVVDDTNGILVRRRDVHGLVEAISALAADPARWGGRVRWGDMERRAGPSEDPG